MTRWLTLAAALWLLAPAAWAKLDLVKVINFSCGHCRASEGIDAPIQSAIEKSGGKFVFATMPASENTARELYYYTLRDAYPGLEPAARRALFEGAQDAAQVFGSAPELTVWLSARLTDPSVNWDWLTANASRPASRQALGRAINLILQSGAHSLPSYILIKDGKILRAFDFSPQSSYAELRDQVLAEIQAQSPK